MKNLKLEDLPRAMEMVLEKLSFLEEELNQIKQNFQPKEPIELMTRQEVADYLNISLVTVHEWINKKILVSYKIGNRVYFKRKEIEAKLK